MEDETVGGTRHGNFVGAKWVCCTTHPAVQLPGRLDAARVIRREAQCDPVTIGANLNGNLALYSSAIP